MIKISKIRFLLFKSFWRRGDVYKLVIINFGTCYCGGTVLGIEFEKVLVRRVFLN